MKTKTVNKKKEKRSRSKETQSAQKSGSEKQLDARLFRKMLVTMLLRLMMLLFFIGPLQRKLLLICRMSTGDRPKLEKQLSTVSGVC